jgi:hypothetical protein
VQSAQLYYRSFVQDEEDPSHIGNFPETPDTNGGGRPMTAYNPPVGAASLSLAFSDGPEVSDIIAKREADPVPPRRVTPHAAESYSLLAEEPLSGNLSENRISENGLIALMFANEIRDYDPTAPVFPMDIDSDGGLVNPELTQFRRLKEKASRGATQLKEIVA